jgi:hypothetical protein
MPAIDDLTVVRRLLDVPGPRDDVVTAGRNRLDELVRREAGGVLHRRGPAATAPATRRHHAHRTRARPSRKHAFAAGLTALVTATVATFVVVAANHGQVTVGHGRANADRGQVIGKASLRTAVLAALDTASGQIGYIRTTTSANGRTDGVAESWSYPWLPQTGQEVRNLTRIHDPGHLSDPGDYAETETIYRQPAAASTTVKAEIIEVLFKQRKWYEQQTLWSGPQQAQSPSYIRQQIAAGRFTVAGKAEIDGRPAIKLIIHEPADPGVRTDATLWVDAATYLPLRSVIKSVGIRPGGQLDLTTVNDMSYLAPTAANLAKVHISIPAGFTRESLP